VRKELSIAVDVTPIRADGANGGAKPFVLHLLRGLVAQRRHTYTLLTLAHNHQAFAAFEADGMKRLPVDGMPPPIGLASRGLDVLFCPMTSPHFAEPDVPTVCTLYDLQHLAYPWFFSAAELTHRTEFYRALSERADAIVAISEFSRNAFLRHFDVPVDRTSVVPIAIHQRLTIPTAAEARTILSALDVPAAPFAFYPANFWPHKNHRFLFLAFERFLYDVPDAGLHLVLTGDTLDRGTEIRASIARMGLSDRIHVLGFVSDVQLAAIWREATLLVFPSLYEGFGIPVLEALQFGTPVLCSREGSLPEVGGEDVTYFDARDPQTLIDAMREVLRDLPAAVARAEAARQRIARADCRNSADEYAEIFERVATNPQAHLRRVIEQLRKVEQSRAEVMAELEATRKSWQASEADRAARLRVIEDQGRQIQALLGNNLTFGRGNRNVFRVILARLRGRTR
jgi:glycosyltransferase involved in cell wall biosynthesis